MKPKSAPLWQRAAFTLAATGLLSTDAAAGSPPAADRTFAITDPHLVLAPYVWKPLAAGTPARVEAMMPGAYVKALVSGTTTVGVLIDGGANAGAAPAAMPIVDCSIDEGEYHSIQLSQTDGVYRLPLATGLDPAQPHRVDLVFRSAALETRWESSRTHLRLAGFQLDAAGRLLPRQRLSKNAIVFGDSITEGVLAEGKGPFYADLTLNNARVTWAPLLCQALQCEYGQLGTGGHGMVRPIQMPPLPQTWDRYDAATSRLSGGRLLPEPEYIFCLLGTNDMQPTGSRMTLLDITAAYHDWLAAIRLACPGSVIFAITPPLGLHQSEIVAAVAARQAAGDHRVRLIDTSSLHAQFMVLDVDPKTREFVITPRPSQLSGDGAHPTVYGNGVLGTLIAVEVGRQLAELNANP